MKLIKYVSLSEKQLKTHSVDGKHCQPSGIGAGDVIDWPNSSQVRVQKRLNEQVLLTGSEAKPVSIPRLLLDVALF